MNKTECLTLNPEPSEEANKIINNPRHVISAIIKKLTKCSVNPQNSDGLCPHAAPNLYAPALNTWSLLNFPNIYD